MVGTGMCPTTMTMTHRKGPLLTSTFKDNIHSIMFSDSQQIQQLDDLTIHYTKNIPIAGPSDAILQESAAEFWGTMLFVMFGNGVNAQVGSMHAQRSSSNVIPSLPTGYLELKLQCGILPQRGKSIPSSQTSPISNSPTLHRTAFPPLQMGRRDRYRSAVASQAATSIRTHTHIPHTCGSHSPWPSSTASPKDPRLQSTCSHGS